MPQQRLEPGIYQSQGERSTTELLTHTLVTDCNPNDLDIWTDWCRLGLQFVVYKSAEQEWSFVN